MSPQKSALCCMRYFTHSIAHGGKFNDVKQIRYLVLLCANYIKVLVSLSDQEEVVEIGKLMTICSPFHIGISILASKCNKYDNDKYLNSQVQN